MFYSKHIKTIRFVAILFILLTQICFAQNSTTDSLINLLNSSNIDTNKVNIINNLATTYYGNNSDKALKYANQAIELSMTLNYVGGLVQAYQIKANVFYSQSKYSEAISNFMLCLNYYSRYKNILLKNNADKSTLAGIYNVIGVILYYQADYDESLSYYLKSISVYEEIGNKGGVSDCYNNIGIIYQNQNDNSKALFYHFKSLSIKYELKDTLGEATSYNNIGEIYRSQNQFEKALNYYYKGLNIKENTNDIGGIATACNNIGYIYLETNRLDSAFTFINRCLNYSLSTGEKFDIAESYLSMGEYYKKIKNYTQAENYFLKAYNLSKELGTPEIILKSSEKLSEISSMSGNYKQAFYYFKDFKDITDKLHNEEKIKKMTQLELQHEFDQKQKESKFKEQQISLVQKSKLKRQRIISYASLAGLVLTLLLVFVIYRNYNNKKHLTISLMNQKKELEKEKKKSDKLLLNILPFEIAEELKKYGKASVKQYNMVSVMFADVKGFTMLCEEITPFELISELDNYFERIDLIIEQNKIEKIKTAGDSYMCAGGVPIANKSNPIDMVLASLAIQKYMKEVNKEKIIHNKPLWQMRIGIHTGPLLAGVIGKNKFAYDIWGDTVNVAARLESTAEAEKVNVSGETYQFIRNYFDCTFRGRIPAKNKGDIDMYFVNRIKLEYSSDEEGYLPNNRLIVEIKEINKT